MTEATRARIATGAAGFGVAAPAAYILHRLYAALFTQGSDPVLIILQTHTGFYWRALTAVWAAGFAAALVYVASGNHAERMVRALTWLAAPVLATAVVLAWVFP